MWDHCSAIDPTTAAGKREEYQPSQQDVLLHSYSPSKQHSGEISNGQPTRGTSERAAGKSKVKFSKILLHLRK